MSERERLYIHKETRKGYELVNREMAENKDFYDRECDIFIHHHALIDTDYEYKVMLSGLESQLQTKDALIKELIECVEYAYDNEHPEMYDYIRAVQKKARTLLDSEAVKKYKTGF